MRIIAGEFRGRKLLAPDGDATRPITDRVKQSLFDILAPRLPGSAVYDCFAGTGSLGLECISRGSRHATFFEMDRSALHHLRENVETFKAADRAMVIAADLFKWIKHAPSPTDPAKSPADIIFLDPPYRLLTESADQMIDLAARLSQHHLADDGILIFRHAIDDVLPLSTLRRYDMRDYGSMRIELLQRA